MENFGTTLLMAFALLFVIEGLLYAVFTDTMRRMMMQALSAPPEFLRNAGFIMVLIGFTLVYLIDFFGGS
jgi:uncharacterized protein